MYRSSLLPLSLCLLLALPAMPTLAADKLDPGQRDALLQKLDALRESGGGGMSATFTETRKTRLLKNPLVTSGEMKFQSPDKFRREITGSNRSITVSNGDKLWIYYPNFNEVEIYSMGEHAFFDDSISALTAGMSYARMPEFYNVEAYRDGAGYQLKLSPKKRNLRRILERMTLWINGSLNPVRTVVELPKGDQLVTEYGDVRRQAFPGSEFDFTPPGDAKISRPMGK